MGVRFKHLLLCQRKTFANASCASRIKQFMCKENCSVGLEMRLAEAQA